MCARRKCVMIYFSFIYLLHGRRGSFIYAYQYMAGHVNMSEYMFIQKIRSSIGIGAKQPWEIHEKYLFGVEQDQVSEISWEEMQIMEKGCGCLKLRGKNQQNLKKGGGWVPFFGFGKNSAQVPEFFS